MTERSDRPGAGAAETLADPWAEETIPIRTRSTPELPEVSSVGRIEAPSTETPDFSEMTVPMRPAFAPPGAPSTPDAPDLPSAPTAPSAPSLPGAPSTPSAPSAPDLAGLGGGVAGALVPGAAGVIGAVQTAVAVGQLVAAGVTALASALDSGPALAKVRFTFWPTLDSDAEWKVRRMVRREELSGLYRVELDLACDDLTLDPRGMHGKPASLILERDVVAHRVAGIVSRVETQGHAAGHQLVRVVLVPALDALRHRINSRIFQDKSVPEIVELVMTEGLARFERSMELQLSRQYPTREYCVQHRESDLSFCMRLLAEEGISFFFEQSEEAERVVLVDGNEPFPVFETMDGEPIHIAPAGADLDVESIRVFDGIAEIGTSSVVVSDHDWTQPDLDLAKESRAEAPGGSDFEHFEYPGPLTLHRYDDGGHRYAANDGTEKARLRRELCEARGVVFHGSADVTGLAAGRTFELRGSVDPALDRKYLVVAIDAEGEAPEVIITDQDGVTGSGERFRVRFECIPASVPFRPARRPRPLIAGHQRAIVVGPAGEEIHTDHHGRIKVQFPWDREGQRNERSSCWMRVLQPWSGAGWGHGFIPRIGMEVVVSFEDGDPDRPLVLGCVHNGANPRPRELPAEKTRSIIRTATTPGGPSAGHNELSFEDAAGNEEVYLRAQKNLREEVLHDHATSVGNDQSNVVAANRSTRVSGSHSESVSGSQSVSVGGDRTKSVRGNETTHGDGNRRETVQSNENVKITGNRTHTVMGKAKARVSGTRSDIVIGNETVSRYGRRKTTVGADDSLKVGGVYRVRRGPIEVTLEETNVTVKTIGKIRLETTGCSIELFAGAVTITGTVNVELVCGGASQVLHGGDGTIEQVASTQVLTEGGGSTLQLSGGGAHLKGPIVRAEGEAVSIDGGVVTINGG